MNLKRLTFYVLITAGTLYILWLLVLPNIFKTTRPVPEPSEKFSIEKIDPLVNPEEYFKNWKKPDGPLRVGLQVGHWKIDELPEELAKLKLNGGTSWTKTNEWEVNLAIAEEIKKILESNGIVVDLLPAAIPPDYWADAFVSIHADGSEDLTTSGFKVAYPRRDLTGKAQELKDLIEEKYGSITQMRIDPNITRNMTGYYAFNWRRYEYSIHPMTPAVIVESGFLTNYYDRRILLTNPKLPARGISEALIAFLKI